MPIIKVGASARRDWWHFMLVGLSKE